MDIIDYVSHDNFISFFNNRGKAYFSVWMAADVNEDGDWITLDGRKIPHNIYIQNFMKQ